MPDHLEETGGKIDVFPLFFCFHYLNKDVIAVKLIGMSRVDMVSSSVSFD